MGVRPLPTITGMPPFMLTKHNQMRMVRKRTCLVQEDIAYILQCPDYASVSRWERGTKVPPVRLLILYHVLFDVPIEALFQRQRDEMAAYLRGRIHSRISHLRSRRGSAKIERRISFLEGTVKRLSPYQPL